MVNNNFQKRKNTVNKILKKKRSTITRIIKDKFLPKFIFSILAMNLSNFVFLFGELNQDKIFVSIVEILIHIFLLFGVGCLITSLYELSTIGTSEPTEIKFDKKDLPYYIALYKKFKGLDGFISFIEKEFNKLNEEEVDSMTNIKDPDLIKNIVYFKEKRDIAIKENLEALYKKRILVENEIRQEKNKIGLKENVYTIDND